MPTPIRRGPRGSEPCEDVHRDLQELWELLKAYAQQETVDPLKGLEVRRLGLAARRSAVSASALFLAWRLLRLLQTETGTTFTGTGPGCRTSSRWSWPW